MGRLIPAGTGIPNYRFLGVVAEEGDEKDQSAVTEDYRQEFAESAQRLRARGIGKWESGAREFGDCAKNGNGDGFCVLFSV